MVKRALWVGIFIAVPLAASAQQFRLSNSPARLVSPEPPAETPLPVETIAPTISATSGELAPATAPLPPPAPALAPAPALVVPVEKPAAADSRGTEQSPLAVKILPAPADAARLAREQQDRAATNFWLIGLAIAMVAVASLLLVTLVTMIATTRRQLRAYLFVSRAEIVDLELGSVPIVQLDIKNTGQTPAYHVTHVWRCGSFSHPLAEKLPLPLRGEPVTWAHLGPGAMARCHRTAEKQISAGGELANRPIAFYVYGEIVYRDVFKRRRFTRYVFFQEGFPRIGPGQLIAFTKGNEAN